MKRQKQMEQVTSQLGAGRSHADSVRVQRVDMPLEMTLRAQSAEIARAGHNGWGNTMLAAAEEIEKLRAEIEQRHIEKAETR